MRSIRDAFHGRTLATMSASGKPGWDSMFKPQVAGFPKARLNDLVSVQALIGTDAVAIMVEPVQGESGVHAATPTFLQGLRGLCDLHELLLILMKSRPASAAWAACSATSTFTGTSHRRQLKRMSEPVGVSHAVVAAGCLGASNIGVRSRPRVAAALRRCDDLWAVLHSSLRFKSGFESWSRSQR
jgi:hypothetical protein